MPHHWRPAEPAHKHGEKWELCKIDDGEAKDIEKKPRKHPCERVLYP